MAPKQGRPSPDPRGQEPREVTRLESDEEIRQALQARRQRVAAKAPATAPGTQANAPAGEPVEVEPQAERPLLRPPMAMLCLLDDGKLDGEWVRLRADRTVIGRTEGDVRIPHDGLISSRHAEIVRENGPNGYRWLLVDLHSTNGSFVRIGSSFLKNDHEVIIGAGRYRFESSAPLSPGDEAAGPQGGTQAWSGAAPVRSLVPALVELAPSGPVNRLALTLPEYWIGSDAKACAIARPDDLLMNAKHARLYRDSRGQWHFENNKSRNGLWLRIQESIPLGGACQFRLGEQRFIFRGK